MNRVFVDTSAILALLVATDAVRSFREQFALLLEVIWVGQDLHDRALDTLLQRGSRRLSLVDVTSFLVIGEQQIEEVFAFDRHFENEGFRRVGSG